MYHNSKASSLHYRPSDDEVALARMLDKVLRRSDALDKESLCIIAGQRVSFSSDDSVCNIASWHGIAPAFISRDLPGLIAVVSPFMLLIETSIHGSLDLSLNLN
jgi:hypothetical protein